MKRTSSIVVIGAGDLGREIVDTIRTNEALGGPAFAGFLDDDETKADVIGPIHAEAIPDGAAAIIGIGTPETRFRITQALGDIMYATVIHPSAIVSPQASVAAGSFLAPYTYVGTGTNIGFNCVLNIFSSAGHDVTLGAYCVLSPYATLNGWVTTGEGVFLGTHAAATPSVKIGAWSKIAAGTTTSTDCDPGSLVAGARPKSRKLFRAPEDEATADRDPH